MALITRTYTFTDGTTAYGSQVEFEVANIVNTINSLNSGSVSWTSDLKFSGAGSGIILTTPDGLHTYRISIDNGGVPQTTQVS